MCVKVMRSGEIDCTKGSRAMSRVNRDKNGRGCWPVLALLALVSVGEFARLSAQPSPPPPTAQEDNPLPPPRQVEDSPPAAMPPASSPPPLCLADAIRRSLANVETVQANVAVQTATVGRFEALKQFVPLINLPQLMVGFSQLSGSGNVLILPDVTEGALLTGQPGLQQAALNRVNLFLPLDPSGHITALPIAEEGIRAKLLMEHLVRRSQVMLAIQHYFETKQILYGIRTAQLGLSLARENLALTQRKLVENQTHDVEVTEARVAENRAAVLLTDLEKVLRISQRRLAVVLHQSRLLVPQQEEPIPIELDREYQFVLDDPDGVDLRVVPNFPASRAEAIELAKRQRVEVRLLLVGLRIAHLQKTRSLLGLLGAGQLPAELGFKNASPVNGGIALGAIFGASYGLPLLDIGLWSGIRKARLDVVRSQLDLEKALLDVAEDAGNAWDLWQQAIKEWELREAALQMRHEQMERQDHLFQEKQTIWVEVLGTRVNLLQADANRWTAWYNLQLARLDVLRSTEQLLEYVERAKIAKLTAWQQPPPLGIWHRWLPWLASRDKVTK
jgi:outer membrane protein TolC